MSRPSHAFIRYAFAIKPEVRYFRIFQGRPFLISLVEGNKDSGYKSVRRPSYIERTVVVSVFKHFFYSAFMPSLI